MDWNRNLVFMASDCNRANYYYNCADEKEVDKKLTPSEETILRRVL